MIVRIRNSSAFLNFFGTGHLCEVELDELPRIGDSFQHELDSYRIVKVLEDVDPESGSDQRGAIAFVMRIGSDADACRIPVNGKMQLAYQVNTAKDMRDCIERANLARKDGDLEGYRRHVEEFLFLSHAVTRDSGSPAHQKRSVKIPYIPILSESAAVSSAIRHGFIHSCFAAHVAPIASLTEVTFALDRIEVIRPTVFIITDPITLRFGLMALHLVRTHARSREFRIVALVGADRRHDEMVAMSAGADACALYPQSPEQFSLLVSCIQDLLKVAAASPDRTQQEA
jgi:hypothetical protein